MLEKQSKVLTTRGRDRIKEKNFALDNRRYPIHDINHARAALSMVAKHGTPAEQVKERLTAGYNVILEIEIDGARQVRKSRKDAVLVFIAPPSWEELKNRLETRGTDTPERRAERLALAQEELTAQSEFDYVLVNDQLERVIAELVALAADKERR